MYLGSKLKVVDCEILFENQLGVLCFPENVSFRNCPSQTWILLVTSFYGVSVKWTTKIKLFEEICHLAFDAMQSCRNVMTFRRYVTSSVFVVEELVPPKHC